MQSEVVVGVVEEELPRALYRVRLESGETVIASLPIESRHSLVAIKKGFRVEVERSVHLGKVRILNVI